MTFYTDLTFCDYFDIGNNLNLLAVGWLEQDEGYKVGSVEIGFYEKLEALLVDPWQPLMLMGIYECSLCQFDGHSGTNNLFIPYDGKIFVAPELILHYINCHNYQPPEEFIQGVLDCPDMNSMEYKKLLLANGGRELIKNLKSKD